MKGRLNEYIVHDANTDDILALGTASECTNQLGYKNVECFYAQICSERNRNKPNYARRNKNIIITLIENDEDILFN